MRRELGDIEFMGEMLSFFGSRRTFELIGWCLWWSMIGARSFADIYRIYESKKPKNGASRSASYRSIADIKRFREHLIKLEEREYSAEEVSERLVRLNLKAA